jgi:ankyrin repeat protein
VKAAVANGGVAVLEPDAEPASTAVAGADDPANMAAVRQQIVKMGYELKPEALFQAIGDRNAAAVQLFLKAGISPNAKNEQGRHPLNHAVLFCAADQDQSAAIIIALVNAKSDVKSQDPDNKTTPLVGAVQSCKAEAIDALIKAGSDLGAKSAGGMTALQLADVFGRQDIAALLRKAGAK